MPIRLIKSYSIGVYLTPKALNLGADSVSKVLTYFNYYSCEQASISLRADKVFKGIHAYASTSCSLTVIVG